MKGQVPKAELKGEPYFLYLISPKVTLRNQLFTMSFGGSGCDKDIIVTKTCIVTFTVINSMCDL